MDKRLPEAQRTRLGPTGDAPQAMEEVAHRPRLFRLGI